MQNYLQYHQWLLTDHNRTDGYRNAINRIVKNDDVVLDIGSGTGILSFFACLAGARKVYAVEQNESIELAKLICSANGFGERIEFLKERSQNIRLPESVDIIVTDTGASFGLQDGILGTLIDAKKRFLKPEGQILPQSVDLFVSPIELSDTQNLDVWNKYRNGLDLSPARQFAANTNYQVSLHPENVLGSPDLLASVNFQEANSQYVDGSTRSVIQRAGVMHGLGAWMTVNLIPGISFSNSAIDPTVDWARSFFPVGSPVAVKPGDCVLSRIRTYNGQAWHWQVEITDGSGADARIKARFDQSTLGNFPIQPAQLKKKLLDYVPTLSRKGEAEVHVLSAIDGKRTSEEVADELLLRFEDCFPTKTAATEFVVNIVKRCS